MKTLDGLGHQYTPEGQLHQTDAQMISTMGEQPLDHIAYKEWHKRKMAYIKRSLCRTDLSWFLRPNEFYKNDWAAFVSASKKKFSSERNAYYATVENQTLTKNSSFHVKRN